jgi:hypothetical protein
MISKANSTLEQTLDLEVPVSLTPDQIAEAAGGAAAAALIGPCCPFPIIFGGIWGPLPQDLSQGLGSVGMA